MAPDGKVDDRVGHVHLVRDRVGLGIELERTSEPSTLSGDDRGVLLPGLVNFGHELRIQRDRADPAASKPGLTAVIAPSPGSHIVTTSAALPWKSSAALRTAALARPEPS